MWGRRIEWKPWWEIDYSDDCWKMKEISRDNDPEYKAYCKQEAKAAKEEDKRLAREGRESTAMSVGKYAAKVAISGAAAYKIGKWMAR